MGRMLTEDEFFKHNKLYDRIKELERIIELLESELIVYRNLYDERLY